MNTQPAGKLNSLISYLTAWQWFAAALIATVLSQYVMGHLNGLYTDSLFPVSIYEGQTTFNADTVKGYYAVLLELGTFDKYIDVQLFDFIFILTVFTSFLFSAITVFHMLPQVQWLKAVARTMIIIAPLAAVFDALENIVSFFMLADPQTFSDWLVIPYSFFAVAKFFVFTLVYVWIPFGALIAGAFKLVSLVTSRTSSVT